MPHVIPSQRRPLWYGLHRMLGNVQSLAEERIEFDFPSLHLRHRVIDAHVLLMFAGCYDPSVNLRFGPGDSLGFSLLALRLHVFINVELMNRRSKKIT